MLTTEQQDLVRQYDRYPAFVLSKLPRVMLEHANRRGTEDADVLQAGFLGLVKAAQHYNPNLGVTFGSYAFVTVRRCILDELRACLIHVPKRDRPSRPRCFDYQSLDETALIYKRFGDMEGPDGDGWLAERLRARADGPDPGDRLDVEESLAALPERWAVIVRLRSEGLTFREAARRLGMTHQRVRQVYEKALGRLRRRFRVSEEAAA